MNRNNALVTAEHLRSSLEEFRELLREEERDAIAELIPVLQAIGDDTRKPRTGRVWP